jgi:hypothetical protein
MKRRTSSELEDLRMLFQTKIADTAYFKQQQWHATNYAMLSYAAIITLFWVADSFGHEISFILRYVASVALVAFTFIAAFAVVSQLDVSLGATRDCVKKIVPELSEIFRRCYNVKWAQAEEATRDGPFPMVFHAYNIIGALIALWIIWTFRMAQV